MRIIPWALGDGARVKSRSQGPELWPLAEEPGEPAAAPLPWGRDSSSSGITGYPSQPYWWAPGSMRDSILKTRWRVMKEDPATSACGVHMYVNGWTQPHTHVCTCRPALSVLKASLRKCAQESQDWWREHCTICHPQQNKPCDGWWWPWFPPRAFVT